MQQPIAFIPPLTRRRALAWMAASAALASGCTRPPRERIYPWVQMQETQPHDDAVAYASAHVRDGHAMGVLVETKGGRPTKVEGNPLHPSSLGATDVFAQAAVLDLWDPDRSGTVMQRTGGERASRHDIASWLAFETMWSARAATIAARSGEGFAILTGPVTSPSLRAQLAAWLSKHPRARWFQHAALEDLAAREGSLAAFGRIVQPVYRFDRARCVLALGADPFSEGPGAVRHAMDWSAARRGSPAQAPWLFAVEATPGLFGARSDARLALAPAAIDALASRLANLLAGHGEPTPGFESRVLRAIRAAGPDSLIVPGACASAATHALVHAMHAQLGAQGRTVDGIEPLALAPEAGTLAQLDAALRAGAIDTLVMLDANPVHETGGAFGEALRHAKLSIHAGTSMNETAKACHWHLPLSHDFESWGDARAHDGTVTLLQPAIAPLRDTRSANETVALLARDDVRDGHAIVQQHWRSAWGADFDGRWRESLVRGFVRDSAAAPVAVTSRGIADLVKGVAAAPAPDLVALFTPDASVHDGRFANNAWLQELPRPFTKITWDNAILLGPATAQRLGVASGDRVRASVAQAAVEAPVWILHAQAEGVATLPLGYGRRAAGRVGDAVGFDAYTLKPAGRVTAPLRLERIGGHHDFAVTQHEMDPHGRELARIVDPGQRIESHPQPSLYPEPPRAADNGSPAWAMTIDLDSCIGCNACTIACQAENNIPVVGPGEVARGREMHWIRVDRYDTDDAAGSIFQPVPCMHCEKAPCELVCPVGATVHDTEGLNVQVYNRCIGTRFCSQNCPYKVRRFNFLQYTDETTESLKGQRNPEVTVRQRGVMEKCTYCIQRVARARQHAQAEDRALREGDVVTACQSVCPTRAIHFGDLHDPASGVAADRRSPRHYALLGELNTQPRTTYLARVRRRGDEA